MNEKITSRECIMQLIRTRMASRHAMQRLLRNSNAGITFEMLQIMSCLWSEQGVTQQTLAERTAKDKACSGAPKLFGAAKLSDFDRTKNARRSLEQENRKHADKHRSKQTAKPHNFISMLALLLEHAAGLQTAPDKPRNCRNGNQICCNLFHGVFNILDFV